MTTHSDHLTRRRFLQATAAGAGATLASGTLGALAQQPAAATPETSGGKLPLPTRKLGRSGIDLPMLGIGGDMGPHSPQFLDQAWSMGIRYFDTADCYLRGKSEQHVAQWLAKYPERRKELFLVSKDHPRGGVKEMLAQIDTRLKTAGADYLDAFYIHQFSPREYGQSSLEWPKSDEFKQVAEQIKKSGKARLVGFSCHDAALVKYLEAAAEGGFLDIVMFKYSPLMAPTDELNRAIDACHKAGIGLIAMKTMLAHSAVSARLPELDKLGLTTRQGLLQAVWSDERLSGICSNMGNLQQMQENTDAARMYNEPLKLAEMELLREVAMASQPAMCPNCDGRCSRACGQELALGDIARLVSYYERHGDLEARELYHKLEPALRDAAGADLAAASHACLCNLDFASIVQRAERYFA